MASQAEKDRANFILGQISLLESTLTEVATRAEELEPCAQPLWGALDLIRYSRMAVEGKYNGG